MRSVIIAVGDDDLPGGGDDCGDPTIMVATACRQDKDSRGPATPECGCWYAAIATTVVLSVNTVEGKERTIRQLG